MKIETPPGGLRVFTRKKIGENKSMVVEVRRDMLSDRDIVTVIRDALRELGVLSWAMPTASVQTAQHAVHKSPRFGEPQILGALDGGQMVAVWLPPAGDAIFKRDLQRTQSEKMARARAQGILVFLGDDPKLLTTEIAEQINR